MTTSARNIDDKIHKKHKKLKPVGITMALLPISACGGGDSKSPTDDTPMPIAIFVEETTGVFIAVDNASSTLDQGTSTIDLTVTGKGGNDVINTGSGADEINSGDGSDKIRSGAGADTVNAGGGNDVIVLIGTTRAGQYDSGDLTNAGNGYNLSSLISIDDLNNHHVSDVVAGDVIDGGAGTNTLFIYGEVDLTGVMLNNVTILEIHSVVTLTPDQLALFITVNGDGSSTINIDVPAGDNYVLDLTGMSIAGIEALNIDGDLTIIISDNNDLEGIMSISSSSGLLNLSIIGESNEETFKINEIMGVFENINSIDFENETTIEIDKLSDFDGIENITVSETGALSLYLTSNGNVSLQAISDIFSQVDEIIISDNTTLIIEDYSLIDAMSITSLKGDGKLNTQDSIEALDKLESIETSSDLEIDADAMGTIFSSDLAVEPIFNTILKHFVILI